MEEYKKLMDEMPNIAKAISGFPDKIQEKAFDVLVGALVGYKQMPTNVPIQQSVTKAQPPRMGSYDLSSIATKTPDGKFHLSVRDLKASTASDATKRLVYILIKTYTQLMGSQTVSRNEIINPYLKAWRLYDGNARKFLANDPGITRSGDNGDLYGLDIHAEKEAEQYIQEIFSPDTTGTWKPGSRKNKKKKGTDVEAVEGDEEEFEDEESEEESEERTEESPQENATPPDFQENPVQQKLK